MTRPTEAEIRIQCNHALRRASKYAARLRTSWPVDLAGYRSAALYGVAASVRAFDPARGGTFATVCYTAVLNELHNERRRQDPRPWKSQHFHLRAQPHEQHPLSLDRLIEEGGDAFLDLLPDRGPDPAEMLLREAEHSAQLVLFDAITEVVETLPPRHAHMLRRVYLDGVSARQAAREVGYAVGGAGAALRAARQNVQKRLGLERR